MIVWGDLPKKDSLDFTPDWRLVLLVVAVVLGTLLPAFDQSTAWLQR